MKILLVEPEFPIPPKSKNHRNFLPIGLLKLASYHRGLGDSVKLIRGNKTVKEIRRCGDERWWIPDKIMTTSLFTYWAKHVKDSVAHYRKLYPNAMIVVGGVYASLMPDHCKKYTTCDEVFVGAHEGAEKSFPAYDLIENNPHPLDYQIVRTSRGCIRNCEFCGVRRIESCFKVNESLKDEIRYRRLVFYDDNLLANPYIEEILNELIEMKNEKKILWCESQSGFDGKILKEKPCLAEMIKKAGFHYPRIAWDWGYENYQEIKEQLDALLDAGYRSKDVFVFMLYNWKLPFEEMEGKRLKCWEWQVQVADCRYRPLDQTHDRYDPKKTKQTGREYHIHKESGWTDELIKTFRSNIRKQNICLRQNAMYYSADIERKRIPKDLTGEYKKLSYEKAKEYMEDAWNPAVIHYTQDHALSEAVTLRGVEPFHLNVHLPTKLINIDVVGQKLSSLLTNQE